MVPLPDMSPVIWVLRMKVPVLLTVRRGMPGGTVVSGEGDLEGAAANSEVVPGNVHPSEEGRRWIVVGPARLAIVRAAGVNASTSSPGDPTVSGLPGADALSAAARSEKNCKESAGRFVVESNRVAKVRPVSTCERAWVEAGEGGAAVAGERCAGVVGGGGSGIVVGDDDLVGVIRVGQSVCLRLGRVRNVLGAGDQIDIRAAIHQGGCHLIEKLRESTVRRRLNLPVPRRRQS